MMLMLLCQSFCTEQVLIQLQLRLLSWQGFAGIVKINQPSAIEKNNLPRSPKSSNKNWRWCLEAPNRDQQLASGNLHSGNLHSQGFVGGCSSCFGCRFPSHFMSLRAVCIAPMKGEPSPATRISFMDASTKCFENTTVDIPNNILLPLVVSICGSPNITPLRIIIPNRAKARMEYYES